MINPSPRFLFLALTILTIVGSASLAHADSINISAHLDSLLSARCYDELETFALRTLTLSDTLDTTDRANLHKYLGIIYIIRGREEDGKRQFAQWLNLDPAGYIDKFNYPPMIVRAYNEVKLEMERTRDFMVAEPLEQWEPSTADIIKSALVPGWGQITQGKTGKGIAFLVLQSVSIAGWFVSDHNLTLANNAYQWETDPAKFDELYNTANNWNYARWTFTFSSIGIYILAQSDFFFLPPEINLSSYPDQPRDNLAATSYNDTSSFSNINLLIVHF